MTSIQTPLTFQKQVLSVTNNSTVSNTINQRVYGETVKKDSLIFDTPVKITESNVIARLDNPVNLQQTYTFGPKIPNRWVAVGSGTNKIAYSSDGIGWTGITGPFGTFGIG